MNMAILGVRLDSEVYPWDMCEGEGREGGREGERDEEGNSLAPRPYLS